MQAPPGLAILIRISYRTAAKKKNLTLLGEVFLFGGDGEIRTLDTLLGYTRFPIVRARPTTRHLHVCSSKLLLTCQLAHYNPGISESQGIF